MNHLKPFWSAPAERSGNGAFPFEIWNLKFEISGHGSAPVALANTGAPGTLDFGPWALDNELSPDGWCLIAPFGEWPKTRLYREGGRIQEQKFIQVLDHAAADALVSRENSFFGRLKRALIGVPVYKGHGDEKEIDPRIVGAGGEKIKLGVVDQLRKGARGLEAHFALDHDGAAAVRAGWKYPSGFWYALPFTNEGLGSRVLGLGSQTPDPGSQTPIRCRPFKLISVALTPHPNISGVESLANAAATENSNSKEQNSRKFQISSFKPAAPEAPVHPEVVGKAGRARQGGGGPAGWETRETADWEVCGTKNPPTSLGCTADAPAKVGQASSLTILKTDRQDACPTLNFPHPAGVEPLANAERALPREVQPHIESDMKLITGWLLARGVALANTESPTEPQILEALQQLHATQTADVTALGNDKQTLAGQVTALANELTAANTALGAERQALAAMRQGRAEALVDLALHRGKLTVAQRDAHVTALANSPDLDAAARALLAGPAIVKTTGQEVQSGKQCAGLANEQQQLQSEYNQAFQSELIAAGQNPARAHHNIMTLPKYAALAQKLMPKTV